MTAITDPALLRASHIIPWSDCNDELDVHNGLLLSALWDAAFDQGLLSFADDGTPLFGPKLSETAAFGCSKAGIAEAIPVGQLWPDHAAVSVEAHLDRSQALPAFALTKSGAFLRATGLKPRLQRGFVWQRHVLLLRSCLAEHHETAAGEVEIWNVQPDRFAAPLRREVISLTGPQLTSSVAK